MNKFCSIVKTHNFLLINSQADLEYESHKKKLQRDLEDLEFKKSSIERKKSALEEELADSNNQVTKLQVN